MKHSTYMDRALRSRDPRFARVLGKLGYATRHLVAKAPGASSEDDLDAARARYQEVLGKRPYHGWSADELREKIAAAGEA